VTYRELLVIGGFFWALTYLIAIRKGFIDKTYSFPMVALAANISWEAIFSFIIPLFPPQLYIDYVWFFLDLVIVYQFLKFGRSEFPLYSSRHFYASFATAVAVAFGSILSITYVFQDWLGVYTAFGQNLMMSILFIAMLLNRNSIRGQSIYIAIFKMIGTAITSYAYYLYQSASNVSFLMFFLFISILVFDAVYVGLLYQKTRSDNIPVFSRL
jgi:hypothetical protein